MRAEKLDRWRALVEVSVGEVRVTSRNGHDLTDRIPAVRSLLAVGDLVLDGELVHDDGSMRSFYGLLGALHRGSATFVAFDVLAAGDEVLVKRRYADRRAVLATLTLPVLRSFRRSRARTTGRCSLSARTPGWKASSSRGCGRCTGLASARPTGGR